MAGLIAILTAGCDSTIHRSEIIGGVDTLSIDAKQRLMIVGDRFGDDVRIAPQPRVSCSEPSPDAMVAKAAALAVSAAVNAGDNGAGSGGGGGGFSETAANIGFRDHTVQMLRDGYYRLCEAYMNGGITEKAYRNVILNADTFMVVASALQALGSNQVVPPVVITAGSINNTKGDASGATAAVEGGGVLVTSPSGVVSTVQTATIQPLGTANFRMSADNAEVAAGIIRDYLRFRQKLNAETAAMDKADERALKARGVK